ncbi:MAG: hypothetical protein ABJA94_04515 [Rhodoglobus sp.]
MADAAFGECPNVSGNLGDGAAILTGTGGAPGLGDGSGDGTDDPALPAVPVDKYPQCQSDYCPYNREFRATMRPIAIADIAAFRPDPGVDHMEPNGWMVVGLDTNFFATGGTHVKDGTLFGQPASVRFTPVAWHWSYSDGGALTTGGPGGTWAAQGIQEFDKTTTSHIFRAPGSYVIDLSIDYSAEYRFAGTGWIAIAGILPVPANRLVATAGDAKTVLVERDCTIDRGGPGC